MFTETDFQTVMSTQLFRGVPELVLRRLINVSAYELRGYSRGETVFTRQSFTRSLGVILEGGLRVTKENADGHRLVMSTLGAGKIFGAATLFNGEREYAVELTAISDCRVVLFSQTIISRLIEREPAVALNYIRYLSERILFLNRKIDYLTSGTAEQRLAGYLIGNLTEMEYLPLPVSMTQLAADLNISRASLYRAMDALLVSGAVEKSGTQYRVGDTDRLCDYITQGAKE